MTTISAVRAGLVARLNNVGGLRAYPTMPDQINAPAAVVVVKSGQYSLTMGSPGNLAYVFEVILYIAPVQQGSNRGQEKVDPYLDVSGSSSIVATVEADITLGGTCDYATVTGFDRYDALRDWAGQVFWGAVLTVVVSA